MLFSTHYGKMPFPSIYEVADVVEVCLPSTSSDDSNRGSTSPESSSTVSSSIVPISPKSAEAPSKNEAPTICSVCGDTATGHHYEVASCNGCKTFFRRTILAQRKYECQEGWECFKTLPKEKRCNCKACRFKKCVDVGMNPLAIKMKEDPGENEMIRSILRKRNNEDKEEQKKVVPVHLVSVDDMITRLVDGLMYLEIKADGFRRSKYDPETSTLPSLQEILETTSQLCLGERTGPMYFSNFPGRPEDNGPAPQAAFKDEPKNKFWLIFDLIVNIEFAKTFSFFNHLSGKDRLALMKHSTFLMKMLTQAYYSYFYKSEALIHPDGTMLPSRCQMCPSCTKGEDCGTNGEDPHGVPTFPKRLRRMKHRQFVQFVETPQMVIITRIKHVGVLKSLSIAPLRRYEIKKAEYVLLKAILLCNTAISDLSDDACKIIQEARLQHVDALFKTCMKEYGTLGPSKYASFLGIVDTLESLAVEHKKILLLGRINKNNRGIKDPQILQDLVE